MPWHTHLTMKILAALFKHETNTFSPLPTTIDDFDRYGTLPRGKQAYDLFRHSGYSLSGLLASAEAQGADVDVSICARALPSRPVERSAFERFADEICRDAAKGYDVILLDLHGAMVAEHHLDGEGELLARVRRAAPHAKVAAALDFHGNISPRMVDAADVLVGYKTYPHIDMAETGRIAGDIVIDSVRKGTPLAMAVRNVPVLAQMISMDTDRGPMADLIAAAKAEEEREGVLSVSVFGGFPLADTPHTGLSVVAVTRGSKALAQAVCDRVGALAWASRDRFTPPLEPLPQTIARAKAWKAGPVLLLDHADNCNAGGTQDTMTVIEEALAQGLTGILAGPVCDPQAVAELVAAGVGAQVDVAVGNKLPISDSRTPPLSLRGTVRLIADGKYQVKGPVFTGLKVDLGRTVVLQTDAMHLVISEQRAEPMDLDMFRILGLDPVACSYLILKSKMQYRPTFGKIAKVVFECNGTGAATMDATQLRYVHLPRPIHPLDAP